MERERERKKKMARGRGLQLLKKSVVTLSPTTKNFRPRKWTYQERD